ncbi:MAG TPA: ABC transporter permease [Thermoanaerobaculia bacterium]|nr:ABC transporter permease [Thermoanaerobaculia bacterium]
MSIVHDLRYALRSLRKSPGFAAAAIATLALGIGANTAIFSVVRGVLLKPLPYPDADRIVALRTATSHGPEMGAASFPDMTDWRSRSTVFEEVGGTYPMDLSVSGATQPEHVDAAAVTAGLMRALGVRPAAGRIFADEDDRAGARVIVVSDGFWRTILGGRRDAVGSSLRLNGRAFTVIGILRPGFRLPVAGSAAQLWLSAAFAHESSDGPSPAETRGAHFIDVFGKLKPGVTLARAQNEMTAIGARLQKEYPDTDGNFSVRVVPAAEPLVRNARPALTMLIAAVGLVLLIACANAANLVLARSAARRAEITIRAAIGASRIRIVGQLVTESVVLAVVGGVAGTLLAAWGVPALLAASGGRVPRSGDVTLDLGVLVFALALSLATGILFGLAPAIASATPNLADALRERGSTAGGGRHRLRAGLLIGEVAVAFVLLAGAGLLLRSLARLVRVDPGFDARGVLTARLDLPGLRYPDAKRASAAYASVVDDLRSAPGIVSAGAVMPLPLSGFENRIGFALEPGAGIAPTVSSSSRRFPWEAAFAVAEPGYFRTLGIAVRAGREFDRRDDLDGPGVAVVNEALARKFFPDGNALGRRIRPSVSSGSEQPAFREIVGVVGDVKLDGLREEPGPMVYVPEAQAGFSSMWLVVRSAGGPAAALASIRRIVGRVDPDLPVYAPQPLSRYVSDSVAGEKFNSLLVALFAGLALALTAIGIFGVISYTVAQRTHEIGVRVAIGARPDTVFRMVVGSGMRLVALGGAAGLAGALLLGRLFEGFLFGVGRSDPATLIGVAAVLGAIAFLACAVPARRAVRIDPLTALREE